MDKWGTIIWLSRIHCGKRRNYEQFLFFPQCFQKLSVVDASKFCKEADILGQRSSWVNSDVRSDLTGQSISVDTVDTA